MRKLCTKSALQLRKYALTNALKLCPTQEFVIQNNKTLMSYNEH